MPRWCAILAYDGTAYQGFQRQASGTPTVQAELEAAIRRITAQDVTVIAAGRTDTGVHATGQVIAFDVDWPHPPAALLRALNAALPPDVALQGIVRRDGFHPRYDAREREYVYTVIHAPQRQPLTRNQAWYVPQPLALDAMNRAAAVLVGRHDFATFGQSPHGDNTVREVFRSAWAQVAGESGVTTFRYTISATAFLHHMVRRIVGLLVNVGRGWLTVADFAAIFAGADRSRVGIIAPPCGLVLRYVGYDPPLCF
ncbi:MAG: tRNA pseudouridine(38-40) synthase TruA [Anaerolineaceae bacterium]|nr:MAG: tRNA pseudouridine(38-40) synthase TruA [Anaerolineaceae bacterium]